MALISEARGTTGAGFRAIEGAAGAGTAVEEGTATGGVGIPAEGEAVSADRTDPGAEPGGLKDAREEGGARDAGETEGVGDLTGNPAVGIGTPAAGMGFGGSFNGGSLTGDGGPVGKSGTGGVYWDGESLTIVQRFKLKIMFRKYSCQSRSTKQTRNLRSTAL